MRARRSRSWNGAVSGVTERRVSGERKFRSLPLRSHALSLRGCNAIQIELKHALEWKFILLMRNDAESFPERKQLVVFSLFAIRVCTINLQSALGPTCDGKHEF